MKKTDINFADIAWVFGAFFGFMPVYVFTLIVVATTTDIPLEPTQTFRAVYFLRLLLGMTFGALLGGFTTHKAAIFVNQKIKKPNLLKSILAGLGLGSLCGAITLGATPTVLLISSTNIDWAWLMIERLAGIGLIMGSVAGAFLGAGYNYLLKRKRI